MFETLKSFFQFQGFMPHGHYYLWKPGLIWLHVFSDSLIALAYFSIPMILFHFIRRRKDIPFPWVFMLFGLFIVACGVTHLFNIWTLWYPSYWASGMAKLVTGIVSIWTAIMLVPVIPQVMAFPSMQSLQKSRDELEQRVQERTSEFQKEVQERIQAEEHLKRMNTELIKLNELKREFTSMVTHELRTPLGAVKEGINLVFDGIEGPVNDSQRDTLGIALRNVDRLARMINNVLDFEKLESGMLVMTFQEIDLNALVEEVYHFMKPVAERKGINFIIRQPQEPFVAVCDTDKIKQVLINLIHNAIKFTESSGVITVELAQMDDQVSLVVIDTGIGIKKKDQEKIFQLFGQIPYQGMWKTGGSGVGLAVCKRIVERHHGTISVESTAGKGSMFQVTFPGHPEGFA